MWDPLLGANKAAVFASVAEKLSVRRLATAHEVAEAVLLLIEDAKRFCAYSNATRGNVQTDVVLV